jgi:hypothetical protein
MIEVLMGQYDIEGIEPFFRQIRDQSILRPATRINNETIPSNLLVKQDKTV